MDDSVLMGRSFIWKLLFTMSHPSEWTLRCNGVVTEQTHAWSDCLLHYRQQIMDRSRKFVWAEPLKIGKNPKQMKDWLYMLFFFSFSTMPKTLCEGLIALSVPPEHENQLSDSPTKAFISKQSYFFSCDPVSMVTLVCPPAAVWAFQPCST